MLTAIWSLQMGQTSQNLAISSLWGRSLETTFCLLMVSSCEDLIDRCMYVVIFSLWINWCNRWRNVKSQTRLKPRTSGVLWQCSNHCAIETFYLGCLVYTFITLLTGEMAGAFRASLSELFCHDSLTSYQTTISR